MTGRPRPARAHKDSRTVTDASGLVNTRHRHTHTGTEHKLGPKALQGWPGRRRAEDPPGPRSSEGRARRFPPKFDQRPLAGARGRLWSAAFKVASGLQQTLPEAPTSAGEWAPVEFGGNLRARPSLDRGSCFTHVAFAHVAKPLGTVRRLYKQLKCASR